MDSLKCYLSSDDDDDDGDGGVTVPSQKQPEEAESTKPCPGGEFTHNRRIRSVTDDAEKPPGYRCRETPTAPLQVPRLAGLSAVGVFLWLCLCSDVHVFKSKQQPHNLFILLPGAGESKAVSALYSELDGADKEAIAEHLIKFPGNPHVLGKGFLFEYNQRDPSLIHSVIDGRNLKPSDVPTHFIDNTNLHNVLRRGVAPMVAFSTDNSSWTLGVGLSLTPTDVLIQPVVLDCNGVIRPESYQLAAFEMNTMKIAFSLWKETGVIKKPIIIHYLNRAILSGVDSFVKQDPTGPDTVEVESLPLRNCVQDMLDKANSGRGNCWLLEHNTDEPRQKRRRTRARSSPYVPNPTTERLCSTLWVKMMNDVERGTETDDKLISVEFLDHPEATEEKPIIGQMTASNARTLTECGRIPRTDLLGALESLCEEFGPVAGHSVPETGCLQMLETDDVNKIGTIENDVPHAAPQHFGVLKLAQFEIRDDFDLDACVIQFALDFTMGNNTINRPCSECVGRVWYQGLRGSTQAGTSVSITFCYGSIPADFIFPVSQPPIHAPQSKTV